MLADRARVLRMEPCGLHPSGFDPLRIVVAGPRVRHTRPARWRRRPPTSPGRNQSPRCGKTERRGLHAAPRVEAKSSVILTSARRSKSWTVAAPRWLSGTTGQGQRSSLIPRRHETRRAALAIRSKGSGTQPAHDGASQSSAGYVTCAFLVYCFSRENPKLVR